MDWVADEQGKIEKKLFKQRYGEKKPSLFLYDVTSSYLEGDQNEWADWGCNRDKKRGKKQIVIGLPCDDEGIPIFVKVFQGNTSDIKTLAEQQNKYLGEHPKADELTALQKVWEKQDRLNLNHYMTITAKDRCIKIEVDEAYLAEMASLDGCDAIKTDLPIEAASPQTIHDRYKDLADVALAFRTCKTIHLEMRPIFVRKDARTRGHVFVVMLAYLLRIKLREAWRDFDITVEESLKQLTTLCAIENEIAGQAGFISIPAPRDSVARLFEALEITPPKYTAPLNDQGKH